MAKDPAFLFYDGDAARDVSHMSRLERGCYFDFLQAQKKFGAMKMPQIQKILGKDFEECWPALNLILTYDKDMYYIGWLKDSIEKRQNYSESRAKNRKGKNQPENKESESTYVNHMEIENANAVENKDSNKKKELKQKIEDALFSDEIFVEDLRSAHRDKDLRQAFRECYNHHSNGPNPPREIWQWRQKLNTWLTIKPEERKNGKQPIKKFTLDELNQQQS